MVISLVSKTKGWGERTVTSAQAPPTVPSCLKNEPKNRRTNLVFKENSDPPKLLGKQATSKCDGLVWDLGKGPVHWEGKARTHS